MPPETSRRGFDFMTGGHDVHAIQPTASEHGRIAALNMAGNRTAYRGSLVMNTLNTLGLISTSYGLWDGVEGGDVATAVDARAYRYLRLNFRDDVLVGCLALGLTQHVGVLRGLIQTKTPLGKWKDVLMADPHQIMSAYLATAQGRVTPRCMKILVRTAGLLGKYLPAWASEEPRRDRCAAGLHHHRCHEAPRISRRKLPGDAERHGRPDGRACRDGNSMPRRQSGAYATAQGWLKPVQWTLWPRSILRGVCSPASIS